MSNTINKLAEALGLEASEITNKLNISQEATNQDIAKCLGLYKIFEDKNAIETYIKNKVSNKMEEIETLKTDNLSQIQKIEDLNKNNEYLMSQLSQARKYLDAQAFEHFKNLNFPVESFETLNTSDLDFSDLDNSILNQAEKLNIAKNTVAPKSIINTEENDFTPIGGVSWFGIGAKREK